MANNTITIKWSVNEIGQNCSNVSAYVASVLAQDGGTFDTFTLTNDNNVTFLEGKVDEAILALTPYFNRITPDNFTPINNGVEVGISFVPRIEGGEYSATELAYVEILCKKFITNYILNAWYAVKSVDKMVAYFSNENSIVSRDLKDALVRFVRPVRRVSGVVRRVSYTCGQQKQYIHINNRSDFALLWRPKDNLPLPDFGFDLVFFTDGAHTYAVNSSNSLLFKAVTDESGKVWGARIIFDFSQDGVEFFNNGVLKYKMYGQVPDADFPDGYRAFEMDGTTDAEIWDGGSDTDVDMITSYIPSYVKLQLKDLTEEEIHALKAPALEAALEANEAASAARNAATSAGYATDSAMTAYRMARAAAERADAATENANSIAEYTEEKGREAGDAAENANRKVGEMVSTFNVKIGEVDGALNLLETEKQSIYTEVQGFVKTGNEKIEEIDNAIQRASIAASNATTATNAANAATNTLTDIQKSVTDALQRANEATNAANKVANDFNIDEEERVRAELIRNEKEIDRQGKESQRQTNESVRAYNDTVRQNEFNRKVAEVDNAISEMEQEVDNAILEMGQKVDNAITSSNSAALSANQAANNATQKAEQASEAARQANAARESIQKDLDKKANKDGNYPALTSGFAENLVGDGSATEEEFSFRPTAGEDRNVANTTYYEGERNGVARIEKIKGNSVVWNQKVHNVISPNNDGVDGWYVRQGINNATIQNDSITIYFNSGTSGVPWISQNVGLVPGHKYIAKMSYEYSQGLLNDNPDLFLELCMTPSIINDSRLRIWSNYSDKKQTKGDVFCFFDGVEGYQWIVLNFVNLKTNYLDLGYSATFSVKITDLTQFGAGNEPKTVEEFYERLPKGVNINAYKDGEIVDGNYGAIKTVGFNQWDGTTYNGYVEDGDGKLMQSEGFKRSGYIRILPNIKYYIRTEGSDAQWGAWYDADKNYIGGIRLYNKVHSSPENAAYMVLTVSSASPDISNTVCVNISWDEYAFMNGMYQPYKPFTRDLSWVSKYFPNGMRSAGSAHDEIRWNSSKQKWEAVQRIIAVDLGTINWIMDNNYFVGILIQKNNISKESICSKYVKGGYNQDKSHYLQPNFTGMDSSNIIVYDSSFTNVESFKNAIQGVMLNYELAEPVVSEIQEDINMDFDVSDYGTEELIVAEGAQSASLVADISYAPNALSTLKQVPDILKRLKALESALAAVQTTSVETANVEE